MTLARRFEDAEALLLPALDERSSAHQLLAHEDNYGALTRACSP